MTRRQRLIRDIFSKMSLAHKEIVEELRKINDSYKEDSTRDKEYVDWVDKECFSYEGSCDYHLDSSLLGYLNKLSSAVDMIEEKEAVKVIYFDIRSNEPYTTYLPKWVLEHDKAQGLFIECPECHSWVHHNSPVCSCGHKFMANPQGFSLYFGKVADDLPKERFSRPTPDTVRHEVEIFGRLFVADYKEVPKELIESQSIGDANLVEAPFIEKGYPFLHPYLLGIGKKESDN